MRGFVLSLGIAAMALVSLASLAGARQQNPPKKRVPALNTEDVMQQRSASTVVEGSPIDSDGTAKTGRADGKVSAEEAAWRESVKKARERLASVEKSAEEAELHTTDLRNQLNASGQGPRERNQTAEELNAAGQKVTELRAQVREARDELDKLLEEGRQKEFTEAEGPKPVDKAGKPSEQFYKTKYADLTQALQTAERRITLYENRVRDLNQRITTNSRTGDNYYIGQIRQDLDDARRSLDEARAGYTKAQQDIEALKDAARRAGLPPGIFR